MVRRSAGSLCIVLPLTAGAFQDGLQAWWHAGRTSGCSSPRLRTLRPQPQVPTHYELACASAKAAHQPASPPAPPQPNPFQPPPTARSMAHLRGRPLKHALLGYALSPDRLAALCVAVVPARGACTAACLLMATGRASWPLPCDRTHTASLSACSAAAPCHAVTAAAAAAAAFYCRGLSPCLRLQEGWSRPR